MQIDSQESPSSSEPTVLDWVRSLFKLKPIPIPEEESAPSKSGRRRSGGLAHVGERPTGVASGISVPRVTEVIGTSVRIEEFPQEVASGERLVTQAERLIPVSLAAKIRFPTAVVLALLAQRSLENKAGNSGVGIVLYLLAAVLAGWALWRKDFQLGLAPETTVAGSVLSIRPIFFGLAVLFSAICYLSAGGNQFRTSTILSWLLAIVFMMGAFWESGPARSSWRDKIRSWARRSFVSVRVEPWHILLLLAIAVTFYFRLYLLQDIPSEMVSDHAEKLLDVEDILQGSRAIYFPRNTGREAFQFYWSVALLKLLGTGTSFLTLKIGTALAGLLTLPFIYLLGKEVGGRNAGLLAMLFAGIGYWPNVISRLGLRFPLYPLFVAPAFYFLVRGLRTKSRNDLLWMGVAAGIGLHGYSPTRVLPAILAVGVILYVLHKLRRGSAWTPISWLIGAGLVAFVVLLPLLRVAVEMPDLVMLRTLTRVGTAERPLPGPAVSIFLSNLWNALRMFAWDNGSIWVISIPGRPALDWVSGGLFHLGSAMALVAYLKRRDWRLLFLLLSIPLLMLPSILSLAFPAENPAPNRASGAIVPVFVLAALPLALWMDSAQAWWRSRGWRSIAGAGVGIVVLLSILANHYLVFDVFATLYDRGAWNTSEMGGVIRGFAQSLGSYDTAHMMAYPYWVDGRLVGINAGVPRVDYSTSIEQLDSLTAETRAQLFLVNPADTNAITRLRELFPWGQLTTRSSDQPGHDFLVYFVPARTGEVPAGP